MLVLRVQKIGFHTMSRLSENIEMCAQVVKFTKRPSKQTGSEDHGVQRPDASNTPSTASSKFHFWVGQSGERYIHTIHTLLDCPELDAVNYLLVRREVDGSATVLAAAYTEHESPSLNLAEIRRTGASMGANEVHVHFLAGGQNQAKVVAFDLRLGQIPQTQTPASETRH
jgi:hypothetical protein